MKVLYHASPVRDLKLIQPKRTLSRDVYIGDYVFATADKRLAAMYLATRGNATLMNVATAVPTIVICNNLKDYLAHDQGGAIYKVPAATFEETPQEGLQTSELVSKVAVKPLDKTIYKYSIDAMRDMGIAIYFVSKEVFDSLAQTKDEAKILESLQPFNPEP